MKKTTKVKISESLKGRVLTKCHRYRIGLALRKLHRTRRVTARI